MGPLPRFAWEQRMGAQAWRRHHKRSCEHPALALASTAEAAWERVGG